MPTPTRIRHEQYELHPGEVALLLREPLRELSPGLMRSYLFDALYTVGTWDDFRYFLPRLLELLAADDVELDPVAARLAYARERVNALTEALHTFFLAYWSELLWRSPVYADLALRWGLMEQSGLSRSALLDHWQAHPSRARVLAELLLVNGQPPGEWAGPEMKGWLEDAYFRAEDVDTQHVFSDALLILERLPDPPTP